MTSGPWFRVRRRSGCWCRGSGVGPRIAHLRGNHGDGLCDGLAEFIVRWGHVRECRAQVSAGAAMGGADLGDRVVAADDGDRLTALDGIEQVREMPRCLGCGHGLHEAILSDNQIHHEGAGARRRPPAGAEATVVRYLPVPLRMPAARRVQPRLAGEAPFR
jgi:hypothetical protein